MAKDFSEVEFFSKLEDEGKWPATMDELVEGWIAYWNDRDSGTAYGDSEFAWAADCAGDLVQDHADLGLDFVLGVLSNKPNDSVIVVLAAGPLEDVIADHGPTIIERVEAEAARSPEFRRLLGGVWKRGGPDDIWQRVLKAAPDRW